MYAAPKRYEDCESDRIPSWMMKPHLDLPSEDVLRACVPHLIASVKPRLAPFEMRILLDCILRNYDEGVVRKKETRLLLKMSGSGHPAKGLIHSPPLEGH